VDEEVTSVVKAILNARNVYVWKREREGGKREKKNCYNLKRGTRQLLNLAPANGGV
jgi:hypothetical protein